MRSYLRFFSLLLLLVIFSFIVTPHSAVTGTSYYREYIPSEPLLYSSIGGEINPVTSLPDMYSGNGDLLAIYMSMIFREPKDKFDAWEEHHWHEFDAQRILWIEQILHIYEYGTRTDMVQWFLQYEQEVASMFQPQLPQLPQGSILHDGHVLTVPQLDRQYFTYMPIRTITSPTSYQWRFRPHLTTDEYGFKRYGAAYAIALGTYYGITIGGIYEIEFYNGDIIFAVLGDVKRDSETDPTNRFHPTPGTTGFRTGNVVEFIMDDESRWGHLPISERVAPINRTVRERFPTPAVHITFIGVSQHATIRGVQR